MNINQSIIKRYVVKWGRMWVASGAKNCVGSRTYYLENAKIFNSKKKAKDRISDILVHRQTARLEDFSILRCVPVLYPWVSTEETTP